MKECIVYTLALLAQVAASPVGWAQPPVLYQAQEGSGSFLVAPLADQGPLFLESAPRPGPGVAALPPGQAVQPVQVGGTVNGAPAVDFGTLPAIFPNNLRV